MKIFFFLFFSVYNIAVFAQSKSEYAQSLLDKAVAKKKIPGLAAIVVYEDSAGNVKQEFYTAGYANKELKLKFTEGTVVEIGSITKVITAYLIVDILQKKKLKIDSKIGKWLPDSVKKNKAIANITFKQLLNHTSGLARVPDNLPETETPYDKYREKDLMQYLRTAKLTEIGKSNYSNTGFGLAGLLAIKISGEKDYYTLVKKRYGPKFGMYHSNDEIKSFPIAQGYMDSTTKASLWSFDVLIGCGGLKYNSNRMASMLKTCLFTTNDTIKNNLAYLHTPTTDLGNNVTVGLGWHTLKMGKEEVIWHNGGTYGFSTFLGINQSKKMGVFVVANQFNANDTVDGIAITVISKFKK